MADVWNVDVASVDTNGNLTVDGALTASSVRGMIRQYPENTYTQDGAIDPGDGIAVLDALAASTAMTLAAGTLQQRMSIICSDATNTCDVDANFAGATSTVTFTAAGQAIDLVYSNGTGWTIVGNNGATLS